MEYIINSMKSKASIAESFHITYYFLIIFQLSLSKAMKGDGESDVNASVATNPLIREIILNLGNFFLQLLEMISKKGSKSLESKLLSSLNEEKEGKKLLEVFQIILQVKRE
jgi:hypothetical protein